MKEESKTEAKKGRGGDTVLAHMTKGEVVIPKQLMDVEILSDVVESLFESAEIDIKEFTVGDKKNSINPETGHPEFRSFFSRFNPARAIKKIVKSLGKIVKNGIGLIVPKFPKIPVPEDPAKAEDVATPAKALLRRRKRRGAASTLLKEEDRKKLGL